MFQSNKLQEVTIYYVIIVFLSFFQVYTYHHYFGLEITSYYSLYEYLICFIPFFVIPLIKILNNYWLLIPITFILFDSLLNNKKILMSLKDFWNNIKAKEKYHNIKRLYYLLSILFIIFGLYCIISLISGLLKISDYNYFNSSLMENFIYVNGNYHLLFQVLFILWCLIIYTNFIAIIKLYYKNIFKSYNINIVFIISFLFIFSSIKTSQWVYFKQFNKTTDYAEFIYFNDTVKTNDNKRMIGGTKDYIFLKEFDSNSINFQKVQIFNIKDVRYLKVDNSYYNK